MSIASDLRRAVKGLQRELGNPTFTWNGTPYKCATSGARVSNPLSPGGVMLEADLALVCEVDQFTTIAITAESAASSLVNAHIVFEGCTYRVESAKLIAEKKLIELLANDANGRG